MKSVRPKVLFLFSNERTTAYKAIVERKNHAGGFWGMIGLPECGVDATFIEIEQYFPAWLTHFIRHHTHPYFFHILLFPILLRYDIVYTSTAFGTQLLHTLYPFKKPVWVMHDFSIAGMIGNGTTFKQRIFRYMASCSGGIVTLGEEEAERLRLLFPHLKERIAFIPYGADLIFFKPTNSEKKNMVFGVGRDPDRDWDTLVRIAPQILANIVIATHERRIAHLRPFPLNVMAGQFSVEELLQKYQEAKVFVLPLNTASGLNDAMGCSALYEALSLGKAIVATDTHTMRAYITDGENGLLVPERNPEALKQVLNRVLGDDVLRERLEKASREYAEENLNLQEQTKKLAEFFTRILL